MILDKMQFLLILREVFPFLETRSRGSGLLNFFSNIEKKVKICLIETRKMTEDNKSANSGWDESVDKGAHSSGWGNDEGNKLPSEGQNRFEETPNDGTNIYIRGIANGVTEQDLEAEYGKYGKVYIFFL